LFGKKTVGKNGEKICTNYGCQKQQVKEKKGKRLVIGRYAEGPIEEDSRRMGPGNRKEGK